MGCSSSSASPGNAGNQAGDKQNQELRLLDEYSVGLTLGEGAFGVVSVCKKRATGEEFAVKMVDKVETPVEAIKKEADMLQSMDHPNIVKFHGVYYERCFVCIVMDKLDGGDLVEGLQRHLKERGQINCLDVVHVAYQMAASIHYLHQRNVVHRDVKGDNYLMDRKNMTDKQCKIVLTDFGTACQASPTDKLSSGVGTKIFWSPEFFDREYSQKVDVWAMGVIMYGLVSGRFPFRDENDVRNKEVRIPKRVHPVCEEFIRKMLDKSEKTRMSATDVMNHPWIAGKFGKVEDSNGKAGEEEGDKDADGMAEAGVNDGIKERRQVWRISQNPHLLFLQRKQLQNHKHKKFVVADKIVQGGKASYEWWTEDQAKKDKLLDFDNLAPAPKDDPMDLAMLRKHLMEHNIDPTKFGVGKAKGIEQLAKEVETGASRLMLDAKEHKKLVRVVDIVVLKLRPADGSRLLVEFKELFPDGRERETLRLPGTKKEPHENARQTSERILREMMNIDPSTVSFDFSTVERQEEETDSPSFPGVTTVYRKELVECKVTTPDKAAQEKVGLPAMQQWNAKDTQGNTKFFTWLTDSEAEAKKVKLKVQGSHISTLVKAPIGLDEEALREYLTSHNIDIKKFGKDGTKSLKEFSNELIKGETRLLQVDGGEILVITEVVMLILQNPEAKETLVQTAQVWPDGKASHQARIPGAKRRPDENQFLCARRILKRQLEIDENAVRISQEVGYIEEDRSSKSYPGLKTVYRKRVIKGEVIPNA
ncbi:unnamed protein product [Effrenium voratum]|uniref:Protein kinase domain-containing protein n=1 Tax=Effrenium voratum TaxID=2562239 RepID=A0AA36MJ74_9DINO|nr:unnamed protein product [Effrenium voratum]